VIFILPYPDSRLLPNQGSRNRKGHWAAHAEVVAVARNAAKMIAKNDINLHLYPGRYFRAFKTCRLWVTWYPKNKRMADYDSQFMACKPFIDGLVDAGVLLKDSPAVIKGVVLAYGLPDKYDPRTEIEIKSA